MADNVHYHCIRAPELSSLSNYHSQIFGVGFHAKI
jgi:hypothetical protein